MKIIDVIEGKEGGYTYQLPDAIAMARQWLDRYRKSGEPRDFFIFAEWVHRFRDDPRLAGIEGDWRGFQKDRDALKIMRGRLDLLAQNYQAQQWNELRRRYAVLLSMVFQVGHHVRQGWNPRDKPGKTISVQMLDNDVLGIRWSDDEWWVEVRGSNYWKWNPNDPLHQLIDRITGNKSELMNGNEIAISSNYSEYDELRGLLSQE